MDDNQKELKALIEHEKKNLLFYSLYWDILAQKTSEGELEKQIDLHLDRLLLLLKLKGLQKVLLKEYFLKDLFTGTF